MTLYHSSPRPTLSALSVKHFLSDILTNMTIFMFWSEIIVVLITSWTDAVDGVALVKGLSTLATKSPKPATIASATIRRNLLPVWTGLNQHKRVDTLVLFTGPTALCVLQQIFSSSDLYWHLTLPVTCNNNTHTADFMDKFAEFVC